MTVRNAVIDCGDDNLAIKSGLNWWGRHQCDYFATGRTGTAEECAGMPTARVLVEDCVLLQGHGASVGSETSGSIRDVAFRRLHFNHTDYGVRLKTRRGRGGSIRNVSWADITMEDVQRAITVEMFYPSDTPPAEANASTTPAVDGVTVRNLTALTAIGTALDLRGATRPISALRRLCLVITHRIGLFSSQACPSRRCVGSRSTGCASKPTPWEIATRG